MEIVIQWQTIKRNVFISLALCVFWLGKWSVAGQVINQLKPITRVIMTRVETKPPTLIGLFGGVSINQTVLCLTFYSRAFLQRPQTVLWSEDDTFNNPINFEYSPIKSLSKVLIHHFTICYTHSYIVKLPSLAFLIRSRFLKLLLIK